VTEDLAEVGLAVRDARGIHDFRAEETEGFFHGPSVEIGAGPQRARFPARQLVVDVVRRFFRGVVEARTR
jgi:hypothetical protein